MSAWRNQNRHNTTNRAPDYYAGNRLYKGSFARTDWQSRSSRRIHDGLVLSKNFGLDTVSDDINSSPYSSPYYINGRYNSDALTLQRGNSASVQGIKRLNDYGTVKEDFSTDDIQTSIEMWQGKQIKFEIPYHGKVVGNTISIKNTDGCTGILSMYFSATKDGKPIYETAIDLCKVSVDVFEHIEVYGITPVPQTANPKGKLYVRMEIWDEISDERSANPFNTGRKIEIAATGKGGHQACIYTLGEKNVPVKEEYKYLPYPNRPLIGLLYNAYVSVPTDRIDQEKNGATVSLNGYRYDIFCVKDGTHAEVIVYDREMNKIVEGTDIRVDGRITQLNIAQCTDIDRNTWVYYVDGHSPLQRFKIGEWRSQQLPGVTTTTITANINEATWWASPLGTASGYYQFVYRNSQWLYEGDAVDLATYGISLTGTPAEEARIYVSTTVSGGTNTIDSIEYVDTRPVVGAKLIMFHNNRLYLAGFEKDPNLMQISEITEEGPIFNSFPYRLYIPNRSPYDTSINPITAMIEYASDQIMILGTNFYSIFQTYGARSSTGLEDYMPAQVSTYVDSAGVAAQGDVCNYKGIPYSFDQKEGLRRFTGGLWHVIPNSIDSHYDRVDMTKPRKIWGYANKLYYNYTDRIDGKTKCIVWDQQMNYQSYPFFQDVDIPFCDVRYDDQDRLIGIHPDYPCIMELYAEDTWRRLDSPITFRRDTKMISVPGGNNDMVVKRVHNKVIADTNRWWWFGLSFDKHLLRQERGKDVWYRFPNWDTVTIEERPEEPFYEEDIYEENAVSRMDITNLRVRCTAFQVKIQVKTFRAQANLISTGLEIAPTLYT